MMVTTRDWILLGLYVVSLSKAPESFIDGTSGGKRVPRELLNNSIDQLDTVPPVLMSDDQLNKADLASMEWQPTSRETPGMILRTDDEEVMGDCDHDDNPGNSREPLAPERRAQIKQNVAINQEQFDKMKPTGEAMVTWINIITKRERMMERYSYGIAGESISSMLSKLMGVKLDIQRVIRSRFRSSVGLGGRVFEALPPKGASKTPQKLNHEPTDALESHLKDTDDHDSISKVINVSESNKKGRPEISSLIVSQHFHTGAAVEGSTEEARKLREEVTRESSAKAEGKKVGHQEKLKPQLPQLNESALVIVYDKHIMDDSFKYLVKILHGVTFRSVESDIGFWKLCGEEIRVTKLTFQRSIIQAIEFMTKFQLVGEEKRAGFLNNEKTLDLIGDHLVDLFHVVKDETYNVLAFIPDMEFLGKHWRTEYLHRILSGLGKNHQAHVLSKALERTVKLYMYFALQFNETDWSNFIYGIIFKERFLLRLENRAPPVEPDLAEGSSGYGEKDLKDLGQRIVNLFQDPFFPEPPANERIQTITRLQAGYFLIYHILNYIKTYHEEYLNSLFVGKESDMQILMKELALFKEGLNVCHLIKQGRIYTEIMMFPKKDIYTITRDDASKNLIKIQEAYVGVSANYKKLHSEFRGISLVNPEAKRWFEDTSCITTILFPSFESRASNWEEAMKREEMRRKILKNFQKKKDVQNGFPNLKAKVNPYYNPVGKDKIQLPEKELLDLWDPESFYL